MKVYRRRRGITPLFLNLGTMLQPLYLWEEASTAL
jgi:hypothetical protein